MPRLRLTVIAEPKPLTRTVIQGKAPFFVGRGDHDLACGSCSLILAKSIVNGQLRALALKCPECNSICEQTSPPPFAVPEGRIIEFMKGAFNFGSSVKCPSYIMIAGEAP